MAINSSYVGTPPGLFKFIHIVFGIIAIACGGSAYESEHAFERLFLWGAVACLIVTFVFLLLHLASEGLAQSKAFKGIDILYHVVGGILLIGGGSLMIASVIKYKNEHCEPYPWGDRSDCQPKYKNKLAGGSFSIINGVFYLITILLIAAQRSEPEAEWDSKPYPGIQKSGTQSHHRRTTTTTHVEVENS